MGMCSLPYFLFEGGDGTVTALGSLGSMECPLGLSKDDDGTL